MSMKISHFLGRAVTQGFLVAAGIAAVAPSAQAQTRTWTLDGDFDVGNLVNTVHSPSNQLQLGATPLAKSHVVWATNYRNSWVVRLDSVTGKQTGRFDAALVSVNGQSTGARPSKEYCDWSSQGNCPGRVAVDTNGDVWIINRAFGSQGTMSKFSGDIAHCIDRNNNGKIDTSTDVNNDGIIDVGNGAEYFGQNDECILTTVTVGGYGQIPRGVVIDKKGRVWASTHNDGMLYRFNPNEPVALEKSVSVGGNPYSLGSGGDYVFVSNSAGQTARVHIDTGAVDYAPCPGTYGVVGDPSGNYAWLGSFNGGGGLFKADFTNHTCPAISLPTGSTATTIDLDGNIWLAGYNNGNVYKYSPGGALLGAYNAGGNNPHGLSVDFQNNLWIIVHGPGNAHMTKMNVSTGAILAQPSIDGTGGYDYDPYIYSDFTGLQINRMAPYTKIGSWSATHDTLVNDVPWKTVKWNTEAEASVPAGTTLSMAVRAANSIATLAVTPFVSASSGVLLANIKGRYVQVQATFKGPGYLTPVLSNVTVDGTCAGVQGENCCVTDADCGDGNSCTTDTCPVPGASCKHSAIASCCHTNADCVDANVCTSDSCPGDGQLCQHVQSPGCCFSNADCADADACTADICSGPGGSCSHKQVNGCCNVDADCQKGNVCSNATCSGPGGLCQASVIPNCCTKNSDCADNDLCTTNTCDVATGLCSSTPIVGCCNVDAQCDDGQACTADKCTGAGGLCVSFPIAGCCMTGADCDDSNFCTTDSCPGPGGSCSFTPVPNCCIGASDCSDGNLCTTDTCPVPGGACMNAAVAGCCNNNVDCDDGDVCTQDSCTFAGGSCEHQGIVGCCKVDADCAVGTCVNHVCVDMPDGGMGGASASSGGGMGGASSSSSGGGMGGASASSVASSSSGGGMGGSAPAPQPGPSVPFLEGGGCRCEVAGGASGETHEGAVAGVFGALALVVARRRKRA